MVEDFKLIILYSICYVTVQPHRVSKLQILIYIFYIKSDMFNNITKVYQLNATHSMCNFGRLLKALSSITDMSLSAKCL
jgi:hypothetical protein